MKTKLNMLIAVGMSATVLFPTACKKDINSANPVAQSSYKMYLTDDPANYQQVNVDITGAQVRTLEQGWITLKVNAGVYNLLNYSAGFDTLLASGMLTTGHVSQVRLLLGTMGNTVMVNNIVYPLQIPSDNDVRLMVNAPRFIEKGEPASVTIDFDAGRSVVQTDSGTFMLKPVIRLVAISNEGSIKGTISPDQGHIAIMAIGPSDTVFTYTRFEEDDFTTQGNFMVRSLDAGTYTLFILPRPPFTITTVSGVVVTSGEVTDVGTVKLQ